MSILCDLCDDNYAATEYSKIDINLNICHLCAENIMEVTHKARYGVFIYRMEDVRKNTQYKKKRISEKLKVQVHEKSGYRCVSCGTYKDLTCDHIKPESLGGETTLDNLQTMCRSCNSSKGVNYNEC